LPTSSAGELIVPEDVSSGHATSEEIAVTTTTKKIIKMRLRGDAQIIYRYRLLEKI